MIADKRIICMNRTFIRFGVVLALGMASQFPANQSSALGQAKLLLEASVTKNQGWEHAELNGTVSQM
jgi:hypothetical protein